MFTVSTPGTLAASDWFAPIANLNRIKSETLATLRQAFPTAEVREVIYQPGHAGLGAYFTMLLDIGDGWEFVTYTGGNDMTRIRSGVDGLDPVLQGPTLALRAVERWVADRDVLARALGGGDFGPARLEVLETLLAGGEVAEMLTTFVDDGVDMLEALAQAKALAG